MKKIKLVHVISHIDTGGAQVLLGQLIQELQRTQEYQQTVLSFRSGNYHPVFSSLGIKIVIIKPVLFLYDPLFFVRFVRTLVQEKPDCIHSVLWAANFLTKLASWYFKMPLVQSLHNNIDQNGRIRLLLDRVFCAYQTPTVAVSDGVLRSLATYAPWMNHQQVTVIKNGIACKALQEKAAVSAVTRADLGFDTHHMIIGSVGRFEPVKNYKLLLTAFALLYDHYPQARLVLVGYGSQEKFLKQRAFDLGITDRVLFVINKPGYDYYRLFDCFVLSSYKEGISLALLEAMSVACPVVITNNELEHDVIQDGSNGRVVPSNNAQLLADALAVFISNPVVAAQYGRQGKKTVEDFFSLETMANGYDAVYKKAMLAQTVVS